MSSFDIYPATSLDSPEQLRVVLRSTVIDRETEYPALEEIDEILASIPKTDKEMMHKYTVIARGAGNGAVLGMMSLKEPDAIISSFALSANPIEITNAYVGERQSGIGSALVKHLESKARTDGRTEVVLVSGPRFEFSGWPFWQKMYGEHVGVAERYFEGTYDGRVWRKSLTETK